jgi:hypothetical protein
MVAYNYIEHPISADKFFEPDDKADIDPRINIIQHNVKTIEVQDVKARTIKDYVSKDRISTWVDIFIR